MQYLQSVVSMNYLKEYGITCSWMTMLVEKRKTVGSLLDVSTITHVSLVLTNMYLLQVFTTCSY